MEQEWIDTMEALNQKVRDKDQPEVISAMAHYVGAYALVNILNHLSQINEALQLLIEKES